MCLHVLVRACMLACVLCIAREERRLIPSLPIPCPPIPCPPIPYPPIPYPPIPYPPIPYPPSRHWGSCCFKSCLIGLVPWYPHSPATLVLYPTGVSELDFHPSPLPPTHDCTLLHWPLIFAPLPPRPYLGSGGGCRYVKQLRDTYVGQSQPRYGPGLP